MNSNLTGYGILADDINENDDDSISVFGNSKSYGSLTQSLSDGQGPWFDEGFNQGASHNEVMRNYYETDSAAEFYCGKECCTKEDVIVFSNNYHQSGSLSEGDQTYYPPESQSSVIGIASSPLVAWNILNLLLSTSLLAFPFAVQRGGLIVLGFIVLIALLTNYTSRILINMLYEDSTHFPGKKVRMRINYSDVAQDALNSSKGALLVQIIQVLEMFAICVLNICVLGNLMHEIIPSVNIQLCIVIAGAMALPSFFIKKLIVVGWLQTIGVFSLTIGLILIQGFCLVNAMKWEPANLFMYNLEELPISIGIVVYAFGIHGVIPGLEEQMRKRDQFGAVVHVTFSIAVLIQCLFSVTNVIFFGVKTREVITIDLESHFRIGVATSVFIVISIMCHFSLPTLVVMDKLDHALHSLMPYCPNHQENNYHAIMTLLLRIIIIGSCLGVAVLLPYFALLLAFVGSSITVFTSLIIPCIFHLRVRRGELNGFQIIFDLVIILLSFTFLGFGTYHSTTRIVQMVKLKLE